MTERERWWIAEALRNAPLSSRREAMADRPDLEPLFGAVAPDRLRDLYDGFVEADALVARLSDVTSRHLERPCSADPFQLTVLRRPNGRMDLDLSAFLDCGAADIAFEVSCFVTGDADRPPPWPVDAWVSVSCIRQGRHDACNHDLMMDSQSATSPEDVVRILKQQIRTVIAELPRIPRDVLVAHDHDDSRTWP